MWVFNLTNFFFIRLKFFLRLLFQIFNLIGLSKNLGKSQVFKKIVNYDRIVKKGQKSKEEYKGLPLKTNSYIFFLFKETFT